MAQAAYDGSRIKRLVENETCFNEYVDKKFAALDINHSGTLTGKELAPVIESLGNALGLPPPGSSNDTDHIYNEIFGEFRNGRTVTKDIFAHVLKDVYLGLADGLERDPISILRVDGRTLREYAESGTFQSDSVSIFTRLDTASENHLKSIMLIDALKSISVAKGMPPVIDPKMKPLVRDALVKSRVNTEDDLDQFQFVDMLKAVVLFIAKEIEKSPISVAYSEKIYEGKSITKLLKDETALSQALRETWQKMPKDKHGKVRNDYLRVGIDELSPAGGLPPVGAVDEMDDIMKTVFSSINLDEGASVTREEFDKTMVMILGSLMMQLEGKPIVIKTAKIIDESSGPATPLPV